MGLAGEQVANHPANLQVVIALQFDTQTEAEI